MGNFLIDKKGITVVTCNMLLADFLSEHGITTYCTGGKVVEYPGILGGELMRDTLSKFNINYAFFSSTSFNSKGEIASLGEYGALNYQFFRKQANKLVYLCGSDKFNTEGTFIGLTLDEIDYFISDKTPPENILKNFKSTLFISILILYKCSCRIFSAKNRKTLPASSPI